MAGNLCQKLLGIFCVNQPVLGQLWNEENATSNNKGNILWRNDDEEKEGDDPPQKQRN